jgi:oxysterol-binding protein-related protein 3/6/7
LTCLIKPRRARILSSVYVTSQHLQSLPMRALNIDPDVRACELFPYLSWTSRTHSVFSNPMLAETFEDSRMNFIAEKVSHQPLIVAYHAEGENWEVNATSSGKTKFWGKSLEIIPSGVNRARVGDNQYEWRKPSSFMRNLMMGNKYLEHVGEMTVQDTKSGARCVIEFKEAGYWGTPNIIAGTVYDAKGHKVSHLEGKWDEQVARKLDSDHLKVLWRPNAFPKNARDYYGFTTWAITLNEITPDLREEGVLCPTDSRLRPDVRALEEGDMDTAEAQKVKVEEGQRARRREGKERKPQWFERKSEDDWVYRGGYWEQRSKGWKDVQPLW